tara:strand:- start:752 stop:1615 length:864 start_codon:yes stop_codon:yes gene_type:complete
MEKVQIGRVVEFYSNSCLVEIKEFKIPCKTPKDQDIVVGDFVEIVPLQDSSEVKGKILKKVNRKTSLKRFHRGKKKVFAANVTNIAILLSPVPLTPKIFIDKWLVLSAAAGIEPLIVANKIDLISDDEFKEACNIYENLGLKVFRVSGKFGEGLSELGFYLEDKTTIFVGKSGSGKSTISSKLLGINLKTKELNKAKGVHTTSVSSLYVKDKIEIIDSPGVRDLEIEKFNSEEVLSGFFEIREASMGCKFKNCNHINVAGCNVIDQLSKGNIAESRYNNYLSFLKNE